MRRRDEEVSRGHDEEVSRGLGILLASKPALKLNLNSSRILS